MKNGWKKALQAAGLIVFTIAVRFLRVFPNNDPIMGLLARGRRKSLVWMFLFPVLAIVAFDAITGSIGLWTTVTALTYGGVSVLLVFSWSRVAKVTLIGKVWRTIAAVLVFDFITGPVIGTVAWGMSFTASFVGQIPFTLWHLGSATAWLGAYELIALAWRLSVHREVSVETKVA